MSERSEWKEERVRAAEAEVQKGSSEVVVGSGKLRAYIREIGKSGRELERSEGWTERRERERKRGAGVNMYPAGGVERAGRCVFAP